MKLRPPSLGETVAILALLISAAGLWESHQDRVAAEAAKAAPAPTRPLVLTARAADEGETLTLATTGERVIQTQTVRFPSALAVTPVDTVGNPRVEAGWFASGLKKAIPEPRKPGRLPVLIVTRFLDDGTPREDAAIYDIGYGWRERLLQGDALKLEGITLVRRGADARGLDALWTRRHPNRASAQP